jgi:integrase/recombinase XerD
MENPVTSTTDTLEPTVGSFLPDIAESLASAYAAAGKSPRTIESYRFVLCGFSRFLTDLGRTDDPDEVQPTDIEDWVVYNRTTRSAVTARSYFLTLKAAWGWVRRRKITANDPFAGVETPTADERVIEIMTDEDVRAILRTTEGPGFLNRRDRAIFHLAADSGLRRSEIAAARLADLDLATGRLMLRFVKSNHDRVIPLSDKTRMEMRRYLKERAALLTRLGATDPGNLFIARTGKPISGFGVHRVFASRAREANVNVDRPVHGWRAWFAVTALTNGANESAVMSIAGWRNGEMLRRYVKGRAQEIALAAHDGFSPMKSL